MLMLILIPAVLHFVVLNATLPVVPQKYHSSSTGRIGRVEIDNVLPSIQNPSHVDPVFPLMTSHSLVEDTTTRR